MDKDKDTSEVVAALEAMVDLVDTLYKEIDILSQVTETSTLRKLNEVPIQAHNALAKTKA